MSNNHDITIYDFENICRTCLSKEDLKPLYEKCSTSTSLVDMLRSLSFVEFTENDGLPIKICIKCIYEIKQAFSFVNCCATTDTILRKCVENFQTQLADNFYKKVEAKQEMKTEIFMPSIHRSVNEVLGDYEFAKEVKKEKFEEYVEQVEDAKIEIEYNKIYDDSVIENYKENDDEKEKCSEKSNHPDSQPKRKCTNIQIEEKSDSENWDYPADEDFEKDDPGCGPSSISHSNTNEKTSNQIPIKDFQSTISDRAFYDPSNLSQPMTYDLNDHMRIHNKIYTCEVCNKTFSRSDRLKTHMTIHTREKLYHCEICNKSFTRNFGLTIHMSEHNEETSYTCEVCSKTFAHSTRFKRHMSLVHSRGSYECKICNKTFPNPGYLKYHMRHHSEKKYTCEVCSKAFFHATQLNAHVRIHSPADSYSCELCNKNFTFPSGLKDHMRTHTGETHTCEVCNITYAYASSLKRHNISQHTEKSYTCEVCSRPFSHSYGLKDHMRSHTGEKPHTCKVCSKTFGRKNTLNCHMSSVHTVEKPYTCEVCSKSYIQQSKLKVHMRTHAGKKPETGSTIVNIMNS